MTRKVTSGGKEIRDVGNAGHEMSLRSPSHPWWMGGGEINHVLDGLTSRIILV